MATINRHLKTPQTIAFFAVAFSSVIVFSGLCHMLGIPGEDFFLSLRELSFPQNQNICLSPLLFGVNIYRLFYAISFLACILLYLASRILKNKQRDFSSAVFSSLFIVFALITAITAKSRIIDSWNLAKILSGKTTEEKYTMFYNTRNIYSLAQYYKSHLSERQKVQLVTDLDLSKDPGMIAQRMLAYFLYPIDVRGIRQEPPTALIFFAKHNALASVPEGFQILAVRDEENLIAIRKKE